MPDLWNGDLAGQSTIQGLLSHYRSGVSNLGRDFFAPCLRFCTEYKRAVGYFSSKALLAWLECLPRFETNAVKIHLLISPELSVEDRSALETAMDEGERQRLREITADRLIQALLETSGTAEVNRVKLFAWMVANEYLVLRFAFPEHVERPGIFHEKIGIFQFPWGDRVAFTGSANESESGYERNYESIDVYRSWIEGDKERVEVKRSQFEEAWAAKAIGLKVLPLSPESAALIRSAAPSEKPVIASKDVSHRPTAKENPAAYEPAPSDSLLNGCPSLPGWLTLRPYQKTAIANWFANKGRGTLKMATGSGKTITALAIATELYQIQQLRAIIIVCPYRHLVTQWAKECQRFGLNPILAFESVKHWQGNLSSQLYGTRAGHQPFLTVITTNATLISPSFQSQLAHFPQGTLIVGDEAHNLGARRLAESLPSNIPHRLALSATPERYFDESGTQTLYDYFGKVLEPEFTLADAIAQGALVHYLYYPILVELTETEAQRYIVLTTKIRRLIGMGDPEDENPALTPLLMERSRLVGSAANKLVALRELMGDRLDTAHTLFYCGDGTVENEVSKTSEQQLAAVARLLGHELGYRVNTYTAETTLEERADLQDLFESGELQGLVAIRCLDEGVDIPAIQTAVILASSNNPRQFVQRRGRILRPHPLKQRATLFDMIVVPPEVDRDTFEIERQLLRKELIRFVEFADLADNAGEARLKLLPLQQQYGLLDL